MLRISALILLALLAMAVPAFSQLESTLDRAPFALENLGQYKRALAAEIASCLNDPVAFQALRSSLNADNSSVELVPFLRSLAGGRHRAHLAQAAARLDREILEAKGIAGYLDTVLEIRLAFPERGLPENGDFLVAYVPSGREKDWTSIEAFETNGTVRNLDVQQAPDRQILVVGLNGRKDLRAGIAMMNDELRKAGLQTQAEPTRGLAVAKLNHIRLNDDQEPWILGDAEIYALVNGISPEASKANVIALELPYLDDDGRDYYPNQVLIVWDNYRYKAANINFYEKDDNANYKELVAMLVKEIGTVVPQYQTIFEIASRIIQLMPDHFFTNDDDYVDVFYTLEMGKTYTGYQGASRNATITLVPYTISE